MNIRLKQMKPFVAGFHCTLKIVLACRFSVILFCQGLQSKGAHVWCAFCTFKCLPLLYMMERVDKARKNKNVCLLKRVSNWIAITTYAKLKIGGLKCVIDEMIVFSCCTLFTLFTCIRPEFKENIIVQATNPYELKFQAWLAKSESICRPIIIPAA